MCKEKTSYQAAKMKRLQQFTITRTRTWGKF